MKNRKTANINEMVQKANKTLALDTISQLEKKGICMFLEDILLTNRAYGGFGYNYWRAVGYQEWVDAGKPDFPEKDRYIYGPDGRDGAEWNRHYFTCSDDGEFIKD